MPNLASYSQNNYKLKERSPSKKYVNLIKPNEPTTKSTESTSTSHHKSQANSFLMASSSKPFSEPPDPHNYAKNNVSYKTQFN